MTNPTDIDLPLKEPVTIAGKIVNSLTFVKPKAKQLRDLPVNKEMTFGHMLDLAAKIANVPPSTINELGMEDTMEVVEIVGNFIAPSHPTGEAG